MIGGYLNVKLAMWACKYAPYNTIGGIEGETHEIWLQDIDSIIMDEYGVRVWCTTMCLFFGYRVQHENPEIELSRSRMHWNWKNLRPTD